MPSSKSKAPWLGKHLSGANLEHSESLRYRRIRLLDLKPGSGEEVIHFDLETHSLDNCPEFIALSYNWGNPMDTVSVLGGGKVMKVTRNLKDALWQLRENRKKLVRNKHSGLRHSQSLRFWIDAICINQLDQEEKSFQVGLMAEVYQRAWHMFAWLGPADKNTDMVVEYLNKIGEKAESCGMAEGCEPYVSIWLGMLFPPVGHRQVNSLHLNFQRLDGTRFSVPREALKSLLDSISGFAGQENLLPLAGMKEFFTRPWWGRIWVLQEVTLARDTDFICGSKMISKARCRAVINAYSTLWEVLVRAFRRDPGSLTQYQRDIVLNIFQHRPKIMLSMSTVYQQEGFGLAALLRTTCVGTINPDRHGPHHLESTRPEDKIYALIGLAVDREELMHLGVYPRYGIPYEEVYTTTMAALLERGHISLLSMCQASRSPNLPSWVPDWSQSVTDMLQDVENDHETLYPAFNACGDHVNRPTVHVVRSQETILGISVMGHIYDEIYIIGRFNDRADDRVVPLEKTFSWPTEWLLEIIRLTYCTRNKYKSFVDRLCAAARTSIGDVGYDENARFARVGNLRFPDAVVLLQKGSRRILNARTKAEVERFLTSKTAKDILNNTTKQESQFGSEIIGRSLGRIPFITKKGHLGLSSVQIRPGDVVAVILGSQVPFILRSPEEGKYEIISEAYIDSIMDGKATIYSDCCPIVLV